MNSTVQLILALSFGFLPFVILGLRVFRPRIMPWWAVFLVTMVLGEVLAVVSANLHEGPETGAGHMGALFLGWAIALLWLMPWLVAYAVTQGLRRLLGRRVTGAHGYQQQPTPGR